MSYSPNLGRWLQQDPIGYTGGTTNLYQMEDNNPVNRIDPSGLATLDDLTKEIGKRFGTTDLGKIEKMLKERRDFLTEIIAALKFPPKKCEEAAKKLIRDLEKESSAINTALTALIDLRRKALPQLGALTMPVLQGVGFAALGVAFVDAYEKVKIASDPITVRTNNHAIKQYPSECKCKPIEDYKTKLGLIPPPQRVRERVETYPFYDPPPPPSKK